MGLARFIGARFCPSARANSRSAEPRHALGRRGEKLAAAHLRRSGYKVLYRTFRSKHGGEIDLVCRDKAAATLVFVEVKTRTSEDFGSPGEAVTGEQKRRIIRGAQRWLRLLHDPDRKIPFRFDVVEVVFEGKKPRIKILRDAFQIPPQMGW